MFRSLVTLIALSLVTTLAAAAEKPAVNTPAVRSPLLGTDTITCYGENERCIVPIYVESDGTATGCVVRSYIGNISVKPPNTTDGNLVKVVWLIQLADSEENKSEYQFAANGVVPLNGQDPNNEFRNKTTDSDDNLGKRFRWTSYHPAGAGNPVKYAINVLRTVNNQTTLCTALDPTITNQN